MKTDKQQGFGLIEILLIVVIVGLLGFVSWSVYQSSQQTAKEQEQTQAPPPAPPEETYVVKFPELGVQMTVPESLRDLTTHKSVSRTSVSLGLSTQNLSEAAPSCSASEGTPLGWLNRVEGEFPENPTFENAKGLLVKQFPGFYISITHPQAQCSDDSAIESLASSLRQDFKEARNSIDQIVE